MSPPIRMLRSPIPFNKLKIGKLYRIDHRESILPSKCAILVSVNRYNKSYHNSHTKMDAIYLKIFTATFRQINLPEMYVFQEDEWAITECAASIVFNKVVEGEDLYILPDDIIREIGKFLLGK